MQCYTQLVPPTAVSSSVCLPFLSAAANNLVIARNSLLQIFALKSIVEDVKGKERTYSTKLVLIAQYNVSGTITSLARVKAQQNKSRSGGELLLVALRDAKLSLVEWDPETFSVSTISIHYYEREDIQGAPWAPDLKESGTILTVDPGNRCAAFKFGVRHLAILPFHQAGDDLVMDDDGDEMMGKRTAATEIEVNGETPYAPSFVLSLLAVDPTLIHPIHLSFLYGYREPTLGVLSSPQMPSAALLQERRDPLIFTVYTLDLEQRASTSLLSVSGLPFDLFSIITLSQPIGGALLIGTNEIIHVDQDGKTNAVAVNEFASVASSFPMSSQSDLGLKLEGCSIEQLGSSSGEMLIVLNTGELCILSFRLDGRKVSGLSVQRVSSKDGGQLLNAPASCMSVVGRGRLFIGSEESDSAILAWSSKSKAKGKKTNEDSDLELEPESEDENDLYAGSGTNGAVLRAGSVEDISFKIHDSLLNLSPLRNARLVRSGGSYPPLSLVAVAGSGLKSKICRLDPEVRLHAQPLGLSGLQRVWSIHAESASRENPPEAVHNVLFTTSEETGVYSIGDEQLDQIEDSDIEPEAGPTIEVASFIGGTRIIQVLKTEVRAYDGDLSLAQIFPLSEDVTEAEAVVAASICEPFILLTKRDKSIQLLKADEGGELEEVELNLKAKKWQSGSLFDDLNDAFHLHHVLNEDSSVLMFLIDEHGGLSIFHLPNTSTPAYSAPGLNFLPPYLTPDFAIKRSNAQESLREILVAELGDKAHKVPYMIIRNTRGDLVLYSPYQTLQKGGSSLQFRKVPAQYLPQAPKHSSDQESLQDYSTPLRAIHEVEGASYVFCPGESPVFVFKSASSEPRIVGTRPARSLIGLNKDLTSLAFVDEEGKLFLSKLPTADFSTGWAVESLCQSEKITCLNYHEPSDRYIIGVASRIEFKLPDDELHPEWATESASCLPHADQDCLRLIDPKTWAVADEFELDRDELVMCIEILSLEVSEVTHERKTLVCVGTATAQGADINAHGCIYVFDVIEVVPDPERPETGRKLKLLAQHKDKGAVTNISSIGTEGFLMVTQGQKCFVRGLKEDGTMLPVAFLDTQCYVSVAKELKGTGLCLFGDAIKGIWFVGYTEGPYYMRKFGKGADHLEVIGAEYLPTDKDLFIIVIDADGILHLYQFDPSNPKSRLGQSLLHLTTFNAGIFPSGMLLLPRTVTSWEKLSDMDVDSASPQQQVLVHGDDGSLALITPVSYNNYRALAALQSHLTASLPHALGLNPKGHRNADSDLSIGGRPMLDGDVLKRWTELGSWKKAESVTRAGLEAEWEARALLEGVWGRGLGFL